MRKYYILLVLLVTIVTIFSNGVLAWDVELNNIKEYDPLTKTITISDSYLVFDSKIADIKLESPEIVYVIAGKNRLVGEFTVSPEYDYNNFLSEMRFVDDKGREAKRQITYKQKIITGYTNVPNYKLVCRLADKDSKDIWEATSEEICENQVINYTQQEIYSWEDIDLSQITAKNPVTIGMFTDVYEGDYIDWIPTMFGKEITEWAVWTSSLNTRLIMYYPMNNTADIHDSSHNFTYQGTAAVNGSGKIGNGTYITPTNAANRLDQDTPVWSPSPNHAAESYSINFWLRTTGDLALQTIGDRDMWSLSNSGSAAQFFAIRGNPLSDNKWKVVFRTDGSTLTNINGDGIATNGKWHMITVVKNGTAVSLYLDGVTNGSGTVDSGAATFNQHTIGTLLRNAPDPGIPGNYDEFAIWNRTISASEITDLYNGGAGLTYGIESDLSLSLNTPADTYRSNNLTVTFNCTATSSTGVLNLSLLIGGVINYTVVGGAGQNLSIQRGITFAEDTSSTWTCSGTSATQTIIPSARSFQLHSAKPVVAHKNITTLYTNSLPITTSWNFSASDTYLSACWYATSDLPTNVSVTCNQSNINTAWSTEGYKTITYCANDTFSNEACGNGTLRIGYYPASHNSSKTAIVEGSSVVLTLVVNGTSINSEFGETNATLMYNGVTYQPDSTIKTTSNNAVFSKTLAIPVGIGNSTGKPILYNWTYNVQNTTSKVLTRTTSTQSISVYNVTVTDCRLVSGTSILNMSLKDEETTNFINTTSPNTATIELDLTITSLVNSSLSWQFYKKWTGANNASACVVSDLLNETDFKIEFTIGYSATDHVQEFYFLDNGTLDETLYFNPYTTKNINLHDLETADSTTFLFTFYDENGLEVPDSIVHTFRKYIGEGVFKEVERSREDDNGETHLHLVEEDVIYYFQVSLEGEIIYTSNTYNAKCLSNPCQLELEASDEFEEFPSDYDLINGTYSLSSSKSTRIVTLEFDLENGAHTINMTVYKYGNNPNDLTIVNSTSQTATSGTLTAFVPLASGNTTYFVAVYQDNEFVKSHWVNFNNDARSYFGTTGYVMAFFITLTLVFMAITEGVLVIIFLIVALIIIGAMALIDLDYYAIVAFICTVGIIIYKLTTGRRN